MKDPALKARLADQTESRDALVRARLTIVEKMEAVAKRYDGDLKAASNDPEMISLIRRAKDIETNLSTNRARTAEMIRASALRDAAAARKNAARAAAGKNTLKKEVK